MHGRRAAAPAPARPRLQRRSVRAVRPTFSALAMSFVAAMMLATSVPALAVTATDGNETASVYAAAGEDTVTYSPQSVEVSEEAVISTLAAETYKVEAAPPPIVSEVANVGSVAIAEGDAVVWPVVSWEKRASGFGPRSAPCGGCSTFHDGIDFNPGDGTPVMSLADGVVVLATENGGGLGVNVEVQHNIGGELITSSYAHMQYGSLAVSAGQRVTAGQQLGLVGTTGQSTGPHLHLEMFGADGVRFDGFAWLSARIG